MYVYIFIYIHIYIYICVCVCVCMSIGADVARVDEFLIGDLDDTNMYYI